jgi:transcription termination factor NusB
MFNRETKWERNKQLLSGMGDSNANSKHIAQTFLKRVEASRLFRILFRRVKEANQKAQTNIELYLDDWSFQHGGITEENLPQAMVDCVDRVTTLHQQRQQALEEQAEAEFNTLKDHPL